MVSQKNVEAELTTEEFERICTSNPKTLIVVDFFAEWCMPCLMLAPVFEELKEEILKARFVKINIEDNRSLAERYNISSIPCVVLIKNEKEIDRIVGLHSKEEMAKHITHYI